MSRPIVKSEEESIATMRGSFRFVAIMECGWCGSDIQVEAENDEEACNEFVAQGVREVWTGDIIGLFCSDCIELARANKLEEE